MSIKVILYDLDGTLLPMDQDFFIKEYFGALVKFLEQYGYEPNKLVETIWVGTKAMIKNDGTKTNEQVFWDKFTSVYGEKLDEDKKYFETFYQNEFDKINKVCGYNRKAKDVIALTKDLGFDVVLATNPIFPKIATEKRIKWAGLNEEDFKLITTYENSRYCKPNLKYYLQIVKDLGYDTSECLMVGNDVSEDMIASELGMRVFLLTDCLINKTNVDINGFPNGTFEDLIDYLKEL